jgi:hypothetical protein
MSKIVDKGGHIALRMAILYTHFGLLQGAKSTCDYSLLIEQDHMYFADYYFKRQGHF